MFSQVLHCNVGITNTKMSNAAVISPNNSAIKTRNAILRMKNCSPKLREVLRQRCQERIQNDRLKILSALRKTEIQESFTVVFPNIIQEEWKNIEDDELCEPLSKSSSVKLSNTEFNLDEELLLEEALEKELLLEYETWSVKQYEELLSSDLDESDDVVCPLCCLGFLKVNEPFTTKCTMCLASFTIKKLLSDLRNDIFDNLGLHEKQCSSSPGFVNVPKNENENNLCIICPSCSFLTIFE